jgi:hypothetical protein
MDMDETNIYLHIYIYYIYIYIYFVHGVPPHPTSTNAQAIQINRFS